MRTIFSQNKAGPWKRDIEKNERNGQHFMTGSNPLLAAVKTWSVHKAFW